MSTNILVVDDERIVRRSLEHALREAGYVVSSAESVAEALRAVGVEIPSLVLLDYRLPDGTGIDVLRQLQKLAPQLPVVMITAHASIGGAVEAMKVGAYDYISKPFEVDDLLLTVERALETGRLREEVARQHAEASRTSMLSNVIAYSKPMQEVVRLIKRVATSEATTILLLGESGVGKGLLARSLHFEGKFPLRPFMHITCTALPEALLESELFGHEKGAFTDARTQKKGLFELGQGGTVFLDEIGDLSPGLQGKLLRVLEDKTFRRVGGTRDIQVSLRIIAATNRDLGAEVEAGRFRRDLYYRLKVIPLEIPPLRERVEDVLPLAQSFLQHFNREFHKSVQGFDAPANALLEAYRWPGNVRELHNTIERAVLLTDGSVLGPQDLPSEIRVVTEVRAATAATSGNWVLPTKGVVLEELEKEFVQQALVRTRGNRTAAARLLGLNRDQIRYRIEKFHLLDVVPGDPEVPAG
jgi:DNA-binding NtrC family response regulator